MKATQWHSDSSSQTPEHEFCEILRSLWCWGSCLSNYLLSHVFIFHLPLLLNLTFLHDTQLSSSTANLHSLPSNPLTASLLPRALALSSAITVFQKLPVSKGLLRAKSKKHLLSHFLFAFILTVHLTVATIVAIIY